MNVRLLKYRFNIEYQALEYSNTRQNFFSKYFNSKSGLGLALGFESDLRLGFKNIRVSIQGLKNLGFQEEGL